MALSTKPERRPANTLPPEAPKHHGGMLRPSLCPDKKPIAINIMQATAASYPWADELEKTVVNSLVTSFGLDFLLFKDKLGGDVNTVHNVRQRVWATDQERQRYGQRGAYADQAAAYHQHENYRATGARDKGLQQQGGLHDAYRSKPMAVHEQRNLDHVISASEVHDDAGRALAELDGVSLANQSSNLQTTHESINKSKKQTPTAEYLKKLPDLIASHEAGLAKDSARLAAMPRDTPEQAQRVREMEDRIRKGKNKVDALKSIDTEAMLAKDSSARKAYDAEVNQRYYTSSKFLGASASAACSAGWQMGTRQMLGMVMAELWFELRSSLPHILEKLRGDFRFPVFLSKIKRTMGNIWTRLQARFRDFLTTFREGVFAGILSSVTTTLFNIFATTSKRVIKILREMWGQLVKAIKLLAFNPEKLPFVELCKAVVTVLNTGVAAVLGTIVYAELATVCHFPFGGELAGFCGALVTGVFTLGLNYFILHSAMAGKAWDFVQRLMPHNGVVLKFQAVNAELDRYLAELARLEFNLDPNELEAFSEALSSSTTELERGNVVKEALQKRDIELPFEMGKPASTRQWLASLAKT